jgi:pimeloyl-ACP methyl ester carboxylesterase
MANATTIKRAGIVRTPGLAWSDRRIALGAAASLAIGAAVLASWLTARGPITTEQALASMAAAVALGVACGFLTGSRWSALLTPLLFLVAFEIARSPVNGPTVGTVRIDSTYGIIAFVTGRLVHAVLVLVPMALGALYGVQLAARRGRASAFGHGSAATRLGPIGWAVTVLLTAVVVASAWFVALPPSTAPILGADGRPLAGSIAELTSVRLGGHDQALMIRGRSTEAPVLLYLAGGPGGTDLGAMRGDVGLEQDFVVVTWDQRGTGKSYAALDPAETHTIQQAVDDTIELTNHLRARFAEERIYLVGNSWGSLLGVLAVQQHPELFHAFVGAGQMASTVATDTMFWEDTIAWADATGDAALAAALREQGPPPYEDIAQYERALSYEHSWNVYPEFDGDREMPFNLFVPENSLMDRINGLRAFLDTFSVLYPQLHEVDLRSSATRLDVPVYMVLGEHEARGRSVPAEAWFRLLDAPSKQHVVIQGAGHRPSFEQPAAFAALMRQVVEETYPTR